MMDSSLRRWATPFALPFRLPEAVEAAIDAQKSLVSEEWEETGPLRVRITLHTGTAEERGGDYFDPTLNRAARLLSAGHGGQVLLSPWQNGARRSSRDPRKQRGQSVLT